MKLSALALVALATVAAPTPALADGPMPTRARMIGWTSAGDAVIAFEGGLSPYWVCTPVTGIAPASGCRDCDGPKACGLETRKAPRATRRAPDGRFRFASSHECHASPYVKRGVECIASYTFSGWGTHALVEWPARSAPRASAILTAYFRADSAAVVVIGQFAGGSKEPGSSGVMVDVLDLTRSPSE